MPAQQSQALPTTGKRQVCGYRPPLDYRTKLPLDILDGAAAGSTSLECRGSSVTQGLSSSTSSDTRPNTTQHHLAPLIQGYLTNEPSPTPTLSIEPRVSNPIQVDALRHHSISTDVPIAKSLFPPSLDAIEPDRDVVMISSSTRSSRVPQGAHVDSGWPTVARHFISRFIFVIAVSVDGLRDPEIDLDFIRESFSSSTVLVASLFNEEATHKSIERKLGLLYAEACKSSTPSQIFVYFTGMGDKSGDMCLFGGITVGPQDLRRWIGKLRPKSTGTRPIIGVLFDVCRRAAGPSDGDFDHNLALVRTCIPYQWAYALYFGPGLPSSRFLSSLFLAAHDVIAGCESFEDAFKSRMAQQGRLLRFIHLRRHDGKKCRQFPENGKRQSPEIQECEWGETGRDALLNLGELIISTFPAVARQVGESVTAKMKVCKFSEWDLSANATTADSGSRFEPHRQDVCVILSANRARERAGATLQTMAPSIVV